MKRLFCLIFGHKPMDINLWPFKGTRNDIAVVQFYIYEKQCVDCSKKWFEIKASEGL